MLNLATASAFVHVLVGISTLLCVQLSKMISWLFYSPYHRVRTINTTAALSTWREPGACFTAQKDPKSPLLTLTCKGLQRRRQKCETLRCVPRTVLQFPYQTKTTKQDSLCTGPVRVTISADAIELLPSLVSMFCPWEYPVPNLMTLWIRFWLWARSGRVRRSLHLDSDEKQYIFAYPSDGHAFSLNLTIGFRNSPPSVKVPLCRGWVQRAIQLTWLHAQKEGSYPFIHIADAKLDTHFRTGSLTIRTKLCCIPRTHTWVYFADKQPFMAFGVLRLGCVAAAESPCWWHK